MIAGKRLSRFGGGLVVAGLWLLLWYAAYVFVGSSLVLPSPLGVFVRLSTLIFERNFALAVGWSVFRVLMSLALAIGLGVLLGGFSFLSKRFHQVISPAMLAIRSAPVVSFIVLAKLWVPSNWVPVVISLLMCLPVVWGNVLQGLGAVDERLEEMASLYNVQRSRVWTSLYLRSVWPYLNAAIFTCLGLGFKVTVAAEVLSSPRYSIGYRLFSSTLYLDAEEAYAWTMVILLLSLMFEVWLKYLLKQRKRRREAA
jgi:NitT/TauT family transport system permease protein